MTPRLKHPYGYPVELPGEDWQPMRDPLQDWLVSNLGRVWSMRVSRLLTPYPWRLPPRHEPSPYPHGRTRRSR